MRLRHLLQVAPSPTEVRHLPDDLEVTFAPMEALSDGLGGLDVSRSKPLSEVAKGSYNYFADGDVLLAKVTPCFENGKKAVAEGLANGIGFATSEVHVLRPDPERIDRSYLRYLLSSEPFRAAGMRSMTGAGGLRRVSEAAIKDFALPTADLDTQKAIADFLDKETARIDQLIEKKQRLVELLGERSRGRLSAVVTGSSTDVDSMEATGNAFLPLLPAHWKIASLKRLADVRGGFTLGRKIEEGVPTSATPYLRVANVQAGYVDLGDVATVEATKSERRRYALRPGDVLMIEGGDNDKLGRGAVWQGEPEGAMHQNHVFAVRPNRPEYASWIMMCSNSGYGRDYFFLNSRQSTNLASVSKTRAERFPIPLPPLSEVVELTKRWKHDERGLTDVRGAVGTSIDRLKEYRSALITAAVTGQIDVTRWGRTGEGDRRLDQIQEEMAE